MGQCTESLKLEIKGKDNYENAEMDSSTLWLLQTIKKISAGINTKKNEVQAYVNKLRDLILLIQKPGKSLDTFQKCFRSAVQTLELAGGIEVILPILKTIGVLNYNEADDISEEAKVDEKKKDIKQARDKSLKERVMAMLFLQNVDKARYGKKYDEIDKTSELGRDEFPITLTAAFDVLVMNKRWVIEAHQQSNRYCNGQNGISFVQGGGCGNSTGCGGQGGRVLNGNPETYANGRPQICPPDEEPVASINGNVIRDILCFAAIGMVMDVNSEVNGSKMEGQD
eukprot:2521143-Ditylum_brightwellii.AAC.1